MKQRFKDGEQVEIRLLSEREAANIKDKSNIIECEVDKIDNEFVHLKIL